MGIWTESQRFIRRWYVEMCSTGTSDRRCRFISQTRSDFGNLVMIEVNTFTSLLDLLILNSIRLPDVFDHFVCGRMTTMMFLDDAYLSSARPFCWYFWFFRARIRLQNGFSDHNEMSTAKVHLTMKWVDPVRGSFRVLDRTRAEWEFNISTTLSFVFSHVF